MTIISVSKLVKSIAKCRIYSIFHGTRRLFTAEDTFRTFDESTIYRKPFDSKYHEWVEADYLGAPMDIHTENHAESPLLSRNNVGMGFLILNSEYTGISQINTLYRRLSDLETNVYKRFVVVTSMKRDNFSMGLNPLEILMFKESLVRLSGRGNAEIAKNVIKRAIDNYLRNISDLSYLIFTYKKPLLVYANGLAAGYGGCLASLSNTSSCYKHSRFAYNNQGKFIASYNGYNNSEMGIPPIGGISFVLSLLRGSLGEYLALTGSELVGADLVWSGFLNRFVSPEAINVMQITADRLVELPGREVEFQLQEHFMPLEEVYSLRSYEWLIHEHFKRDTVKDIIESLKCGISRRVIQSKMSLTEDKVREWELNILGLLSRLNNKTLAQGILQLIREVKSRKLEMLKIAKISPRQWHNLQQLRYTGIKTNKDFSDFELLKTLLEELLIESLNLEIRHFIENFLQNGPNSENIYSWEESSFFGSLWNPAERSGISLSAIPSLRKLHPDYDAGTDCDFDKFHMQRETERWSDDFLQRELLFMKKILT